MAELIQELFGNALWGMFPNETNSEFVRRFLRSCAIGLMHSRITVWIRPWTEPVLACAEFQYLVLVATLVNCSSLLSKLDVHRSKKDERAFLVVVMALATLPYACAIPATLFPFLRSYRGCMLINGSLLRHLAPAVCRWIDQQVSDAQSLADVGVATAQMIVYLAPGWAILNCIVFGIAASPAFLVWTTSNLQVAWPYVSNALSVVQDVTGLSFNAFCSGVSLPLAWMKQWQIAREQTNLRQLPRLKFSKWPPLGHRQTRLLALPRRRPFLGLQCKVIKVSVDDAPEYEAVSHAWEHPLHSMRIAVVGHRRSYHMKVSSRIYDFLHHHQSYLSSKLVWIDSLCIDQENLEERAEQVRIMKDVFGKAAKVIIWLASEKEACGSAMFRNHLLWMRLVQSLTSKLELWQWLTERSRGTVHAIRVLLQNRWFTRVWMVQEVALAEHTLILYGGVCLEWCELSRFSTLLGDETLNFITSHEDIVGRGTDESSSRCAKALRNIQNMTYFRACVKADNAALGFADDRVVRLIRANLEDRWSELIRDHVMLSFEAVLFGTFGFEATDRRDKIFALLGMINDPHVALLLPDYRSTYEEVYMKTAVLLMTKGKHTSTLLAAAGLGLRRDGLASSLCSLPSWIPDFVSAAEFSGQVLLPGDAFDVKDRVKVLVLEASNNIILRAALIDQVEKCGPVSTVSSRPDHVLSGSIASLQAWSEVSAWVLSSKALVTNWYQVMSNSAVSASFDESAFWRTLFANRYAHKSPIPPEDLESMNVTERICKRFIDQKRFLRKYKDQWSYALKDLSVLGVSLETTSLGRKLGISRRGNLVLTPPFAKDGDVVCVFEGLHKPFLLRAAGLGHWQLVGLCYVDKLEVTPPPEATAFQEVTIV